MTDIIDKEWDLKQVLLCTLSIVVGREESLDSVISFDETLANDLDYLDYLLRAFLDLKDVYSFRDYRQELIAKIIDSNIVVDGYNT